MTSRRNILLGGLALAGALRSAHSQPVQTLDGPTIFETGTPAYRFDRFTLPAPTGNTDYVIRVAWPDRSPPPNGFTTVFALDGTAVAATLNSTLLTRMAEQGGPAIVAIGYDSGQRFASLERTRDYTPPNANGDPVKDPRGRDGGHAAAFHDLLIHKIIPQAESIAPLDPGTRQLWGHSYGGLFTLFAAMRSDGSFGHFTAASPSLWWNDGEFAAQLSNWLDGDPLMSATLDIDHGSAERQRASRPANDNAQKLVRMRDAVPENLLEQFDARLRDKGVTGQMTTFDGFSHGETFPASLLKTLGVTDQS
ncbi:alpha/beta hydrolase [Qingshengfaniella alkalisoli]|uniref:Alpha/beta hydrolase n=1 Tax=Qingshengfaniella alkalisoli TaxID=2599296 RepID=A0A5B8I9P2_9RHOB|nr:alpha/beta hydrolase-fold protein [Qingshengfaniella alkalisoli]QDY71035.1 alpha/beta hydrolase [Qingshengfaniella alkalisoli]